MTIPIGYCQCGCGARTEIAKRTNNRHGTVAGEPRRWLNGHNCRTDGPGYDEADAGFATPCWLWQRALNSAGYAQRNGVRFTSTLVHRQMYEEHVGPIPEGMDLDHLCRNRRCVNPAHVEPVPRHVNAWRGRGTRLTPEQAREIKESAETTAELARRFGVSPGAVWHVRAGNQWRAA